MRLQQGGAFYTFFAGARRQECRPSLSFYAYTKTLVVIFVKVSFSLFPHIRSNFSTCGSCIKLYGGEGEIGNIV